MVPTHLYPKVVRTRSITTPVDGPKPCNNLVYLRCEVPGKWIETGYPDDYRYRIRFETDFAIKNFSRDNIEWYRENTLVSAAAFIDILNASDDLDFIFAVESIETDITTSGSFIFEVQMVLESATSVVAMTMDVAVSAYILLYEPRPEPPPPSGNFGKRLSLDPLPKMFGKKKKLVFGDDPAQIRKTSK